jgi:toxin ParE1/3/4
MAQIIWTHTAQTEFEAIVNLIAFENPLAANRFASKVIRTVRQLERFPRSGPQVPELRGSPFRQLVIRPCRVFYRIDGQQVIIQFVMRTERLFRKEFLE